MITLVLGGARSGKSTVAEHRAAALATANQPVTYVATIWPSESDPSLVARLVQHQSRRPAHWRTIEPPYDLAELLVNTDGVVLLDSMGPWLAAQPDMAVDRDRLVAAMEQRMDPLVVVSDEVGSGVHPETALGRQFRDELGLLNQAVAAVADEALLVVAGRVLRLDPPEGSIR